jgi:hypothetical protein
VTNEAELGQEAVDLAQQTSYTWEQYLSRIRSDSEYAYKNTSWFKAGSKLEQAKHLNPSPTPPPNPNPPPSGDLSTVRGRIFLAQAPLDSLAAPSWMVPVCTADPAYRSWYSPQVIAELRDHFGTVEAWCDCRIPSGYVEDEGTGYDMAVAMVSELSLDGPAWGQCEATHELENGYAGGARRFVGSCDANVMNETWLNKVKSQEILLSVELYRNKMPWMLPDWRNANAGIGGNCIACYASETEGAYYTPVAAYKEQGLYVAKHDSVYGVGLTHQDWLDLA